MATKALLVGLNEYSNSKFNLRGCLNDIDSLAQLLSTTYGFGEGSFTYLRDSAATRQGILSELTALMSGARSGDTLVFAFSGHGTQKASTTPEEPDGKDECLVPFEADYKSLIADNELYDLFNQYVTDESIKFTAIYDCCHSGTMFRDLAFDENGLLVEDAINRLLQVDDLQDRALRTFQSGPYNILSACQDDQTAADLRAAGPDQVPRGAFSFALHNFLRANKDVPVALAEPQISGAIAAESSHLQEPNYMLFDTNLPLIRY